MNNQFTERLRIMIYAERTRDAWTTVRASFIRLLTNLNTLAMKKVYCSYHQLFGQCTEQDFNDASTGANPSRMVLVTFPTFTHAVPLHTLEEADWYVCTKHGTTWMGKMADMIDGYDYPEKDTHTNLTSMEAQKIMDTLTYHQHSYSH